MKPGYIDDLVIELAERTGEQDPAALANLVAEHIERLSVEDRVSLAREALNDYIETASYGVETTAP